MKLIYFHLSNFSFTPFPSTLLGPFLPNVGDSHQNAIILYTKLTKKSIQQKQNGVPLCNGECERNVTIEAAVTSMSMVSHVTASVRFCLHSIYSVDLRLLLLKIKWPLTNIHSQKTPKPSFLGYVYSFLPFIQKKVKSLGDF